MIFSVDHLAKEVTAILESLPEYPEGEAGTLKLSHGTAKAGRTERWYNPKIGRFLYTPNPISIEYPALEQGDGGNWITWMSAAQDECLAMKSLAKDASGRVLIGGLGLGILPWMCAAKPLVKSVTVVELQPGVIDLVRPVIDHPKITVVHDDVRDYLTSTTEKYDYIGLDIWPDIGRAVMYADEAKATARRALTRNGIVRVWLDEIAQRLTRNDTIRKSARAARKTDGQMLDNPQMVSDRACDFCGATPFIDCYGFCLDCFANTGVLEFAGPRVFGKAYRLSVRAKAGELNHLAKPFPEFYAAITGQTAEIK